MSNLKSRIENLEKVSNPIIEVYLIKNVPMKTVNGQYPDPFFTELNSCRLIFYRDGQDISHLL